MRHAKQWQDPINAILGIWVVLLPVLFQFTGNLNASMNSVAVGLLLAASAFGAIPVPRAWEELTEVFVGPWFAVSPWVLGYSGLVAARSATVVTGVIILVLSLWTLATDKSFSAWIHQRNAP